ncbi:Helix-turn-helix domain-containing protein [Frankia sp. AiPs1]|uniref:helix-turn-helix domain-containing protein n=1 Tax=Frankia sp. AiPa1 TaxID=573492 RepID=UPI00202B2FD2|nr:helix-turn-helix domain-containing protein [Frankia sp. AiPa1]MCL9762212.1 helix-turn-helix domain-containing protein [Frankia sp. AiPa1]
MRAGHGALTGSGGAPATSTGDDDVRLYDPEQAAALLRVRESTLREWVRRRKVPHRRLGRAIRFSADDLRKIIAGSVVMPLSVPGTAVAGLVPASVVPVPLPERRRSGR